MQDLADHIAASLPDAVMRTEIVRDELTVWVKRDLIVDAMRFMRDDPTVDCKMLIDVCGVDYPEREERFEVVYHLLCHRQNHRLRVKVAADEDMPVPSVQAVFSSAGWFEREAYDLYGILFSDHPDLRRILTDYGFEGHPLRKDFPLTGHVEVRYDDTQRRVVNEPVHLVQEFRDFDFLSPWEGMQTQIAPDAPGHDDSEQKG